jgi:hypothetical protein
MLEKPFLSKLHSIRNNRNLLRSSVYGATCKVPASAKLFFRPFLVAKSAWRRKKSWPAAIVRLIPWKIAKRTVCKARNEKRIEGGSFVLFPFLSPLDVESDEITFEFYARYVFSLGPLAFLLFKWTISRLFHPKNRKFSKRSFTRFVCEYFIMLSVNHIIYVPLLI